MKKKSAAKAKRKPIPSPKFNVIVTGLQRERFTERIQSFEMVLRSAGPFPSDYLRAVKLVGEEVEITMRHIRK